jgi:hypothetical protein
MFVTESGDYPTVQSTDIYISSVNTMCVTESGEYSTV